MRTINKFSLLLIIVFMVSMFCNAQDTKFITSEPVNQVAIILVHGMGGSGGWKEVSKDLSKHLEEPFWKERSINNDNTIFVYKYSFNDKYGNFEDQGGEIGNQSDKWINETRRLWKTKYDNNYSPLITSEYPEKIILITHSQGGLSARAYLTDEDNWRD